MDPIFLFWAVTTDKICYNIMIMLVVDWADLWNFHLVHFALRFLARFYECNMGHWALMGPAAGPHPNPPLDYVFTYNLPRFMRTLI